SRARPEGEHARRRKFLLIASSAKSVVPAASLRLLIGPWDGLHSVPLHPGPLPGERENGPPPLDHTRAGVCPITIGKTPIRCLLFPLPEGEGQGEGEILGRTRKVWHFPGTPQYPVHPVPDCGLASRRPGGNAKR